MAELHDIATSATSLAREHEHPTIQSQSLTFSPSTLSTSKKPLHSYEERDGEEDGEEDGDDGEDDGDEEEGEEDENGEKKYKCSHCPHAFTRKHNLKSHLLIHTQEKPFNCSICSSKFRRLHDLKRHEKLHTGEKPHQCKSCGRKFARADALVRHHNSQAGCAVLIDVDSVGKEQTSNKSESPVLRNSRILPQKRGYETVNWRLERHADSSSLRREIGVSHANEVSKSSSLSSSSSSVSSSSTALTTALAPTSSPGFTKTNGTNFNGLGPLHNNNTPETPENFNLLPYVRLLEARIGLLENKLATAETKIGQLTYAVTGRRPEDQ